MNPRRNARRDVRVSESIREGVGHRSVADAELAVDYVADRGFVDKRDRVVQQRDDRLTVLVGDEWPRRFGPYPFAHRVRTTVAGARSDCSRSSLRRRLRRRWSCERGDRIREFVGVEPLRVDGRETTGTADPEQLNRLVRREPSMRTLACAIDVSVVPSRERRRDRIAANCGCRRIGRSVTSPVVASRSGGSMSVSSPRQRPATVRPRSSSSQ